MARGARSSPYGCRITGNARLVHLELDASSGFAKSRRSDAKRDRRGFGTTACTRGLPGLSFAPRRVPKKVFRREGRVSRVDHVNSGVLRVDCSAFTRALRRAVFPYPCMCTFPVANRKEVGNMGYRMNALPSVHPSSSTFRTENRNDEVSLQGTSCQEVMPEHSGWR